MHAEEGAGTWWGAIVVGVVAGSAGGVVGALADIWSNHSLAHPLFAFVPGGVAGFVVFCLLMHARNMRRDRQQA